MRKWGTKTSRRLLEEHLQYPVPAGKHDYLGMEDREVGSYTHFPPLLGSSWVRFVLTSTFHFGLDTSYLGYRFRRLSQTLMTLAVNELANINL
jgi:hypothetical protein